MALYAIGDLHLCLGAPKPMDVFGGRLLTDPVRAQLAQMHQLPDAVVLIAAADNFPYGKAHFFQIQSCQYPGKVPGQYRQICLFRLHAGEQHTHYGNFNADVGPKAAAAAQAFRKELQNIVQFSLTRLLRALKVCRAIPRWQTVCWSGD